MTNSVLWLSQVQFFLSLGFASLFLIIELGLAWVLLFFKIRAHGPEHAAWTAAYRFWVRVFALAFILAFASSMPVLIQFGSLWPSLMEKIGDVAGPLLAGAILTTFIFKSCFLGAMLFGQRYVSERVHTWIVAMVAIGGTLAVFWIVVLQSWMQTPAGADLIDGHYYVNSWARIVLNPSVGWYSGLIALTAALTVAFLMLGVTAGQTFHRPLDDSERRVFKTALFIAMAGVILQGAVGSMAQNRLAQYQPAKAAATAAYWDSGSQPDLVLFAWPDAATSSNRAALLWHHAGGRWLGQDSKGQLRGLDQFSGMSPPVALTFWSFRLMFIVGLLMALVSWITFLRLRKKNYDPGVLSGVWRRVLVIMTFSGWLGCLAGLCHTFFGLYPYAVNGTITLSEIAGDTTYGVLLGGLVAYCVFYGVFFWGFFRLLNHIARYGVVPVARRRGHA